MRPLVDASEGWKKLNDNYYNREKNQERMQRGREKMSWLDGGSLTWSLSLNVPDVWRSVGPATRSSR